MKEAYIGLGSNLGDRESYLRRAIRALDEHPSVEVARCSSLYETAPVGYPDQGDFLNMVAAVRTELPPIALYRYMAQIEARLGRVRDIRWGPRTIDLDLLLYEDAKLDTPELVIPHPRMWERAFVLVPLLEVIGDRQPQISAWIVRHLETMDGKEGVERWKTFNWHSG